MYIYDISSGNFESVCKVGYTKYPAIGDKLKEIPNLLLDVSCYIPSSMHSSRNTLGNATWHSPECSYCLKIQDKL